jgi:sugar O-acyltransferase (sialic acid O-acetyltransferase NeuD family)
MKAIVLYAIGSPLVVDAEVACARAGITIAAAVRNVPGKTWLSAAVRIVDEAALDDALLRIPFSVVLFTPGHRRRAFDAAQARGFATTATLLDPTSIIARSASIGSGTFINAGCVIAGGSRIGERVVVNRSASIGHHASIGDYASLGPGVVLAGSVTVDRGATLGAGAVVLPDVHVGANAVVAAGSVVRESIPPNTLVGGNPARVLRTGIIGYNDVSV